MVDRTPGFYIIPAFQMSLSAQLATLSPRAIAMVSSIHGRLPKPVVVLRRFHRGRIVATTPPCLRDRKSIAASYWGSKPYQVEKLACVAVLQDDISYNIVSHAWSSCILPKCESCTGITLRSATLERRWTLAHPALPSVLSTEHRLKANLYPLVPSPQLVPFLLHASY